MSIVLCQNCLSPNSATATGPCSNCGAALVPAGEGKNVIDQFVPTCLVHRFAGSDKLEPAVIVKAGKAYYYVATRLEEYAKPVKVPKEKVYTYDAELFRQVEALRQERMAYFRTVESRMATLWSQLQPFSPS